MDEQKHTPGPWDVSKSPHRDEGWQVWGCGIRIAATGHAATFDRANARLIAAAPELLAACQAAESILLAAGAHGLHNPTVRQLRAAITKAQQNGGE